MPAPVKAAKVSRTRADIADQDPAVSMKLPKPGPVAAPHAGCALADTDVQFSESSEIDGGEMFAHACKVGLEAVVSKCVTAIVRREAELRVGQKMHAAFEAPASLMAGASGNEIVRQYRRHVAANAKRLGGLNSGRSRKRALRRIAVQTELA
jgi:hypothetical protein